VRRLFATFAIALAAIASGPSPAQDAAGAVPAQIDPERLTIANEIIDLSFPQDQRRAMLLRAVDTMMVQVRAATTEAAGGAADAGLERIVERYVARARGLTERAIADHSAALFAAYGRAYAREFTRDELAQIRAFVSTPAGLRYVRRSSELLSDPDVAQANTAYMRSVFSTLEPLQAELRRELRDYLTRRTPR